AASPPPPPRLRRAAAAGGGGGGTALAVGTVAEAGRALDAGTPAGSGCGGSLGRVVRPPSASGGGGSESSSADDNGTAAPPGDFGNLITLLLLSTRSRGSAFASDRGSAGCAPGGAR